MVETAIYDTRTKQVKYTDFNGVKVEAECRNLENAKLKVAIYSMNGHHTCLHILRKA